MDTPVAGVGWSPGLGRKGGAAVCVVRVGCVCVGLVVLCPQLNLGSLCVFVHQTCPQWLCVRVFVWLDPCYFVLDGCFIYKAGRKPFLVT